MTETFMGLCILSLLQSLICELQSRDITLPTKVRLVKAMVFHVVMYGCESWTVKKAECRRVDAFELWCWRRLLRVPWTARRSNQSILKEISPGISWDAKAETPVLWPPHAKSWLIGKDSDAGRDWGRRRRGRQKMRWLDGITHWLYGCESEWAQGVGDGQGGLACCNSWGRRVGHNWVTELNWPDSLVVTGGWGWWGGDSWWNRSVFWLQW